VADFQRFQVTVDLTAEGLEHYHDVVGTVFSYVRGLREDGIPDRVLSEVSQLSSIAWNFSEKSDPAQFSSFLAGEMRKYSPHEYLSGPAVFRYAELAEDQRKSAAVLAAEYVAQLVPYSARLTVLTKTPPKVTAAALMEPQMEPWYGTQYMYTSPTTMRPVTRQWMAAERVPTLHPPPPNDLIPSEFTLLSTPKVWGGSEYLTDTWRGPQTLQQAAQWTVFHQEDRFFNQPKGYFIALLALPESAYTPKYVT
jgi:secreted Zn-dependent insulinase-like peptidase